jgi:hypothetical protein
VRAFSTWLKKSTVLTATHSLRSSPSGSMTAKRRLPAHFAKELNCHIHEIEISRVVDPDWIRIQWLCGSGFPGARKWRKFSGKMHFLVNLKKNLPLKRYRYKIALTTFWKKFWWITLVFLIWFDSNFDFRKIWEGNCLRKFWFSLDPEQVLDPDPVLDPVLDPDWAKMLDPDPY